MGDKISEAISIRAANVGRKQRRNELRPQVAATIYAGYITTRQGMEPRNKDLAMAVAIEDADLLLLKLFPILPEVDPSHE